jgi:hypothetical protein
MKQFRRALQCTGSALVAAGMFGLVGCWPRSPVEQQPLAVVRTSPELGTAAAPLMLNDSITVYFTAPVNPLSVTSDVVRVLDADGHAVPGRLRTGGSWITFEPDPPLRADLADGSFRAGSAYRLTLVGFPRPDGLRSVDGARLQTWSTTFRTADAAESRALGLPAPLRPVTGSELPFLMIPAGDFQPLPADAPRLYLHFSLPILPIGLRSEAVEVAVLRRANPVRLEPQGIRIAPVTAGIDRRPGCTLEVDLGSVPRVRGSGEPITLRPEDIVTVDLVEGAHAVRDYAGRSVQIPPVPGGSLWRVVPGAAVALQDWTGGRQAAYLADEPLHLQPGFESTGGIGDGIRPRVRVEAGDGTLGVFRPTRDTVLRPGRPFDRGDGKQVQSHGATFPFLYIDVPEGVTVTVPADVGQIHLLACGGIRIAGTIAIHTPAVDFLPATAESPAETLLANSNFALLAAGDVHVPGRIVAGTPVREGTSVLTLIAGGRIELARKAQPVPPFSILATEHVDSRAGALDWQCLRMIARMSYGVPPGAACNAVGHTPWIALPPDSVGGAVRLEGMRGNVRVSYQLAPPDPVLATEPDSDRQRWCRPRAIEDNQSIVATAGSFVRFQLQAEVQPGIAAAIGRIRLLAQ